MEVKAIMYKVYKLVLLHIELHSRQQTLEFDHITITITFVKYFQKHGCCHHTKLCGALEEKLQKLSGLSSDIIPSQDIFLQRHFSELHQEKSSK